ncbi:hypothetical protein GF415_01900 [Candidatus Micrarchaeota archaeon]|nr:hypothetical protein [Candidatus Micrarchaeota archaeon]
MEKTKIKTALSSIGLTGKESEVYMYVSANPESTAGTVSRHTRIARSKTYEALDRLCAIGLVSHISRDKTKRYYSSGTSVLKGLYLRQMNEANEAIEYIKNMSILRPSETTVRVLDGEDAYKSIKESFTAELRKGDEMLIIGSPAKMKPELVEYFGKFHQKRMARGVKLRILYNRDVEKERLDRARKWKHSEVKCLPKNNSPAWVEIYGNRVVMPLVSDRIKVIAITDKAISESFRNYFELLWKSSKKPKISK